MVVLKQLGGVSHPCGDRSVHRVYVAVQIKTVYFAMIFGVASVDGIWIRPDVMSMVMIELLQIEVRDDSWKAATLIADRSLQSPTLSSATTLFNNLLLKATLKFFTFASDTLISRSGHQDQSAFRELAAWRGHPQVTVLPSSFQTLAESCFISQSCLEA